MPKFKKNTNPVMYKSSGFKMKRWSGYQDSPINKEKPKSTRGTGKTYKQAWAEMSHEEKEKHHQSYDIFVDKAERWHREQQGGEKRPTTRGSLFWTKMGQK